MNRILLYSMEDRDSLWSLEVAHDWV